MNDYHIPVLLREAISSLNIKKNGKYIDCTLGGGGHTQRILKLGGNVLGIDCDIDAIFYVKERLSSFLNTACPDRQNSLPISQNKTGALCLKKIPNLTIIQDNFCHLQKIAAKEKYLNVDDTF